MAKVGMEYVVVAKLTEAEDGTRTYSDGRYLGPASTFNGTPTANDVKDYGDDRVVETDTSVTGGALAVELNEETLELKGFMLGHKYDEKTKELISKTEDVAPYLGSGAIGKSKRDNKVIYRGIFYTKTQYREPSDERQTKQESTTFSHTNLEGNLFTPLDGSWKEEAEFDTLKEAKEWLEKKAGMKEE